MTVRKAKKSGRGDRRDGAAKKRAASKNSSAGNESARLSAAEKKNLRKALIDLRDRLTGQVNALKVDSLTREPVDNTVEDGTDAFDRQLSLNLVSSGRDAILDIDEALRKLDENTYGLCEMCNAPIDKARLKALPFVKLCRSCQAENEKGKTKYRPLSPDTAM